jgi:hypothetical protein
MFSLRRAVQNAERATGHGYTTRHPPDMVNYEYYKNYTILIVFLQLQFANQTTITGMALCHKTSLDALAVDLNIVKATILAHSIINP